MKDKGQTTEQFNSDIDSPGKSQEPQDSRRTSMRRESNQHLTDNDDPHLVDGKYSIKGLVDIRELRKILEKFSSATGFTTGFISYPEQEVLIGTGWRDICAKFHRNFPESKKNCLKSNIYLTNQLKELKELNVHH